METRVLHSGLLVTCPFYVYSHMYVQLHKITLVYVRKDIQDVLFFAALNVSSKPGHGQALGCLVVVISSIKSK